MTMHESRKSCATARPLAAEYVNFRVMRSRRVGKQC